MWVHIFHRETGEWLESVPELLIDQWLKTHMEFHEKVILLFADNPQSEIEDLIKRLRSNRKIVEMPKKEEPNEN